MAFDISFRMDGKTAKMILTGELDAASAPLFKTTIEKAAAEAPTTLLLELSKLQYMASAGLRVLIFAKQKLGVATEVQIAGAQPAVIQTINMTGFNRSVTFVDAAKA
jgi:anti-anti-sigma factor